MNTLRQFATGQIAIHVLFILKTAYKEFADRVGETKAPRSVKTDQVQAAIEQFAGEFSVSLNSNCTARASAVTWCAGSCASSGQPARSNARDGGRWRSGRRTGNYPLVRVIERVATRV